MRYDFQLEAVTEIFAGGSNPLDADLRPATFRGLMRFWFRAMMARYVGSDLTALHRLEDAAFGSTEAASPFILRLSNLPDPEPIGQHITWSAGKVYLGFPFYQSSRDGNSLKRGHYKEGTRFDVSLQFRVSDKQIQDVILGSFWLLVNFGGIGSRTRRGFGGVRVLSVKENGTSLPFNYFKPFGDIRNYYTSALKIVHGWFQAFAKRAGSIIPAEETAAQYTGFGNWQGRLIVREEVISTDSWFRRWGIILRAYRNGANIHPADADQDIELGMRRTTPDYREVISSCMDGYDPDRYDLKNGVFGLPIVFQSSSRYGQQLSVGWQHSAAGAADEDGTDGRRASPLFLRPVLLPDRRIATLIFFFLGQFLPDGTCLPVPCPSGQPLSVLNNADFTQAATGFLRHIHDMHQPRPARPQDALLDLTQAMPPF